MRRMLLAAAAVLGAGLGLGVMAGDAQAQNRTVRWSAAGERPAESRA